MDIICGWCKKKIGEKDGQGIEGESHGICDDCLLRHFPHIYEKVKEALKNNKEVIVQLNPYPKGLTEDNLPNQPNPKNVTWQEGYDSAWHFAVELVKMAQDHSDNDAGFKKLILKAFVK